MSGVCQGLVADLDITGLGIRITFYVTNILTVINACIPGSDPTGPLYGTTLFTFIALMVSAIAQTVNRSISLYTAIIVLHLCYLHLSCTQSLIPGAGILRLFRKMVGAPATDIGLGTAALFLIMPQLVWYVFGLYVWVHASGFGSQPECNSVTKIIVFGKDLSATGSGRAVSLVLLSVGLVLTVLITASVSLLSRAIILPIIETILTHHTQRSSPKILMVLSFTIQWIYVVATVEQTIQRNPVIYDGPQFPITFGQIFPVVTIGASLLSIYNDVQKTRRDPPNGGSNQREVSKVSTQGDALLYGWSFGHRGGAAWIHEEVQGEISY